MNVLFPLFISLISYLGNHTFSRYFNHVSFLVKLLYFHLLYHCLVPLLSFCISVLSWYLILFYICIFRLWNNVCYSAYILLYSKSRYIHIRIKIKSGSCVRKTLETIGSWIHQTATSHSFIRFPPKIEFSSTFALRGCRILIINETDNKQMNNSRKLVTFCSARHCEAHY